jgi:phosphatidylglycerol:prolipoprotein diacylglycerol transferase
MLPVLLDLKFFKIYTFGVFLVLAFFWGSFLLWKNIRLTSHKEDEVFDGVFLSLAGGLFIARLTYVLLNFKEFGFDVVKFILINGYPGLSLYGAFFGGFGTLTLYYLIKKIKILSIIDYFVSPLFLAMAFGKLGSFFSGAEVGTKTKFLLSIKYVGFDGFRHLTALFESIFFFFASYVSYKLLFEIRKEKYSSGFLFAFFIWFFSLTYFIFDKLKEHSLYFMGYRFNEFVSFILLLTSSFYFIYYFRSLIKYYGEKTFKKIYRGSKAKT